MVIGNIGEDQTEVNATDVVDETETEKQSTSGMKSTFDFI